MSYYSYESRREVSALLGMTMAKVWQDGTDRLIFESSCGRTLQLCHSQDCCESVWIESVTGDLADLAGEPITLAEESTSSERPDDAAKPEWEPDSQTWTFYRFATRKGFVVVRWCGESNSYYSEGVDLIETTTGAPQ